MGEDFNGWEIEVSPPPRVNYFDLFWWGCLLGSYAFLIRNIMER